MMAITGSAKLVTEIIFLAKLIKKYIPQNLWIYYIPQNTGGNNRLIKVN